MLGNTILPKDYRYPIVTMEIMGNGMGMIILVSLINCN